MFAISATPIRVYNSVEKKPEAAPRRKRSIRDTEEIRKLQKKVTKYETTNKKLKKLAEWNLRSTKSALKDVQEMLELMEDLYGDDAFE
jgi:predicted RNase H-like nuclease (RuvC/YqgF family)